ncbi:MAG TPA: hypothetical protein VMS99_17685 [Acidimicrobiia bacterium]|nr:hypothetical protein [Acidimicrobiia bacterium]
MAAKRVKFLLQLGDGSPIRLLRQSCSEGFCSSCPNGFLEVGDARVAVCKLIVLDQGLIWDDHRYDVGRRVIASIERFAPGFADLVEQVHVDGPPDLETRVGLTGGHIFHGSCLPEHMWDRRLPYRTGHRGFISVGPAPTRVAR